MAPSALRLVLHTSLYTETRIGAMQHRWDKKDNHSSIFHSVHLLLGTMMESNIRPDICITYVCILPPVDQLYTYLARLSHHSEYASTPWLNEEPWARKRSLWISELKDASDGHQISDARAWYELEHHWITSPHPSHGNIGDLCRAHSIFLYWSIVKEAPWISINTVRINNDEV